MPIIKKNTAVDNDPRSFLPPDEFISESKKTKDKYIKKTMDYYAHVAMSQYRNNKRVFGHNFDFIKGKLTSEDFYQEAEVQSFIQTLTKNVDLPSHIKHYSIVNPPMNTMLGEISKRPDVSRVKAMDEDSKDERLEYFTQQVTQYIVENEKSKIAMQMAQSGQDISEEDLQAMTMEQLEDDLTSYTSQAEKWANRVLDSCKVEFNMKEISEDVFKDFLTSGKPRIHVYLDNSKTGMNVEKIHPVNTFKLSSKGKKYISDVSGNNRGAYAAGIISAMELSEIIERFELTIEEVDHLRETIERNIGGEVPSSINSNITGEKSVKFSDNQRSTWDPYRTHNRWGDALMELDAVDEGDSNDISSFLGITTSSNSYGNKFQVVQVYYLSKKKIGELTFLDEDGTPQTRLVDESYKTIPNEISITWGWVNQWYKGVRIGDEVYKVEPLKFLNYCPLFGVSHDTCFVDLLKPLQVLYNICMNQLFKLLEKEIGVVYSINIRKIPRSKDGDAQDDLEIWEEEARRRGVVFEDDSPENMGAPTSNTNVSRPIDLSRSGEMQTRYQMAAALKQECWELAGITRERLGGSSGATQTATSVQAGLSQSYTQTEPYFAQHQYLMNQVYQAIVDAAQYIETSKPYSTLSYINSTGADGFIRVNKDDIDLRDLKVFMTSRAEDQMIFEKIQDLSQPAMQNGYDLADVAELYDTKSLRQLKDTLQSIKKERLKMMEAQQQQEKDQLEQQQAQFEATMQKEAADKKFDAQREDYNEQMNRISRERVAIIVASAKGGGEDTNDNGIPDALELSKLSLEQTKLQKDHSLALQQLAQDNIREAQKLQIEKEKLKNERDNMKNDKDIAKINARNRGSKAKKK